MGWGERAFCNPSSLCVCLHPSIHSSIVLLIHPFTSWSCFLLQNIVELNYELLCYRNTILYLKRYVFISWYISKWWTECVFHSAFKMCYFLLAGYRRAEWWRHRHDLQPRSQDRQHIVCWHRLRAVSEKQVPRPSYQHHQKCQDAVSIRPGVCWRGRH